MRAALFALAALSLALDALPANAQDGLQLYPWCAYFGNGRESCYYSSFEQCRTAISGAGGMCSQNPWYDAYGSHYSFRGGQSQRPTRRSRQR
jgi:hypothetical protein